jgi:regulatory protein
MAGRTSRSAGADARPCSPADREPRDRRPRDTDRDPDADPESVARTIALGLLDRQPRTRSELARALARRGVPDDVAAAVLDRFTEVGLVDDQAFAAAWVDSRHRGRGLGRRALSAELRRRGVDEAVVREAVEAVSLDEEEAAARALVARRLPSLARLPVEARTRRLVGMLGRKGVSQGLAFRVVREALAAEAVPEDT